MNPEPTDDTILTAARRTLDRLRGELLAARRPEGHWCGELSSSALSTATAVSALCTMRQSSAAPPGELELLIRRGLAYLDSQQNADGGFGDTDRSHSNIATSYLVLAARALARQSSAEAGVRPDLDDSDVRLRDYITAAGEFEGLRRRYGKDKTFVVPIMTNLAIAGLVDWSAIPRLPFEAAVFPGSMYRFLRMPVVSYAIPALVAMGQAHHFLGPRPVWPIHSIRAAAVAPTLRVLRRMQPASGGYLEATPLTSFVLMSLAASGRGGHEVSQACLRFLIDSVRSDGSWPIDTNLACWVTSLAIHALAADPQDDGAWATNELIDWHLGCQYRERHPYTGADPGGWGWTDLSGAVPDGDDTPGALIAMNHYRRYLHDAGRQESITSARAAGLGWLAGLQNRDGGLPTFCRGWGKLPFDRSSTDLTAHLLRALAVGEDSATPPTVRVRDRALRYLRRTQRSDGHWSPLWFGNQDHADEDNPIYGTGRVLLAIADEPTMAEATGRGVDYLLQHQNDDGGWGGGPSRWTRLGGRGEVSEGSAERISSVEETAVAIEGLVAAASADLSTRSPSPREQPLREAIIRGIGFLVTAVERGEHHEPWPIGFYFAKLWYHERLYPIVFSTAALGAAVHWLHRRAAAD